MVSKWDVAHMKAANVYSQLSSAKRRQVGCVIVKDHRIISIGYNGMPSGWDNECEYEGESTSHAPWPNLITKPEVLHAETNAIAKVAKSSESSRGSSLYTTDAPCLDCAKLIHQAGIVEVFYEEDYRDNSGLTFLEECGITVTQMNFIEDSDYEPV